MALPPRRRLHERPLAEVWSEKDVVGVQDFVMLDNFKSQEAFVKNLTDRFIKGKLIYVRQSADHGAE